MILAFAGIDASRARKALICIAPSLVFAAMTVHAPAHADVMELDANGARWVAGGPAPQAGTSANGAAIDQAGGELGAHYVIGEIRQNAAGIPSQYTAKIAELAARYELSPSLLEALVWQESRWRENAVSHAGARGLAQLMPGTARYLGVDPDDPMQNLEGGARYLREQLDRFDGDLEKALAAYNAGPGRVIRSDGIPNIRETQNYVAAIMGRLADHSRAPAP